MLSRFISTSGARRSFSVALTRKNIHEKTACAATTSSLCCSVSYCNNKNKNIFCGATIAAISLAWYASNDEDSETWRPTTTTTTTAKCEAMSIIDKYDIGEMLGQGAFGHVYRAKRKSDGAIVALKQMDKALVDKDEFWREVNALRLLANKGGHVHICNLVDVQTDNDNEKNKDDKSYYYVAMEMVEGGELLEHLIHHGAYSELIASGFLRQFAEALSFVHHAGLVHADLKCENVMLSSWDETNAQVKLIDFGGAVQINPPNKKVENDTFTGTLAYCAPELLRQDVPCGPSIASDMFAVGCIVYILLTGSHPFDPWGDATDDEVENAIKSLTTNASGELLLEKLVFDKERIEGLSESCINMMKQLLHPDPNKRMTSDEFRRHPWVQGLEASWTVMADIDKKAVKFWQKQFRKAILEKYAKKMGVGDGSLTDTNLKYIFQAMDLDGSGSLDGYELRTVIRQLGVSENEASLIIASIDSDKSGDVDFGEFKTIMRRHFKDGEGVKTIRTKRQFRTALLNKFAQGEGAGKGGKGASLLDEPCLRRIFNYIDVDSNGVLEYDEIETFFIQMGMDSDNVSEIIAKYGIKFDTKVTWERFRNIMTFAFDAKKRDKNEDKAFLQKITTGRGNRKKHN